MNTKQPGEILAHRESHALCKDVTAEVKCEENCHSQFEGVDFLKILSKLSIFFHISSLY